jgi:molecular chaperone Hsp33
MSLDQLHRYIFNQANVRGELVRLEDSYQAVINSNHYPVVIQKLLGELMAATSLLTATLKFEGDIAVQLQGEGAVKYAVINGAVVKDSENQQLRGVARWNEKLKTLPEDFAGLFINGLMVITITPKVGQRYQGMVALDKPTLAECIESYFSQSEQLATKVLLRTQTAGDSPKASGMFLQVLPTSSAATEKTDTGFEHLCILTETVKDEELFSLSGEELLYRLYHGENVEIYPPQSVVFKCTCSRQRSADAISAVGKEELLDIVAQEGDIKMNCQYCNTEYRFDAIDVESIYAGTFGQEHGVQ